MWMVRDAGRACVAHPLTAHARPPCSTRPQLCCLAWVRTVLPACCGLGRCHVAASCSSALSLQGLITHIAELNILIEEMNSLIAGGVSQEVRVRVRARKPAVRARRWWALLVGACGHGHSAHSVVCIAALCLLWPPPVSLPACVCSAFRIC